VSMRSSPETLKLVTGTCFFASMTDSLRRNRRAPGPRPRSPGIPRIPARACVLEADLQNSSRCGGFPPNGPARARADGVPCADTLKPAHRLREHRRQR
jgi:hypothetical protein